jgi:hypothetical protein
LSSYNVILHVPEVAVLITGVGSADVFELSSLEHIDATFNT